MEKKLEQIVSELVLIRPVYGSCGDNTELWTAEEIVTDRRTVKSVRKAIARIYAIDMAAQAEQVSAVLDRSNVLPFYLETDRVFIPLKMRNPVHPNDRCCGYVNVSWIREVTHEEDHTTLRLKDGRTLPLSCKAATAAQTVYLGRKLQDHLLSGIDNGDEAVIVQAAALLIQHLISVEKRLDQLLDSNKKTVDVCPLV